MQKTTNFTYSEQNSLKREAILKSGFQITEQCDSCIKLTEISMVGMKPNFDNSASSWWYFNQTV